jgi:transcriptional regulator NrdR family protein
MTDVRTVDISGPRDIDRCPVCTSVQVRKTDDREVFGSDVRQPMSCANCDAKWIDNYRYVSYTIAKPEEDDSNG